MKIKMSNEPLSGQARELETLTVNLNVTYQETLVTKKGEEIMKGEVKHLNVANSMPPLPGISENEGDSKKKATLIAAIEKAVGEYLK